MQVCPCVFSNNPYWEKRLVILRPKAQFCKELFQVPIETHTSTGMHEEANEMHLLAFLTNIFPFTLLHIHQEVIKTALHNGHNNSFILTYLTVTKQVSD